MRKMFLIAVFLVSVAALSGFTSVNAESVPVLPPAETIDGPHHDLLEKIIDSYQGKFAFHYFVVEKRHKLGFMSGRTSCSEVGQLYTNYHENGYMPILQKGVWIEVKGCGSAGHAVNEEYNTVFAYIYMPLAAYYRVHTFQDLVYAMNRYGTLYRIHQPSLATLLDMSVESLPANPELPMHPYPQMEAELETYRRGR